MSQARALRRFVGRDGPPGPPPHPNTWVVAAGKGGVGTSTVALALGLVAAGSGRDVTLVDATHGFGGLSMLARDHDATPGDADGARLLVAPLRQGLTLAAVRGGEHGTDAAAHRRALLRRARTGGVTLVDGGAHPSTALQALADFAPRLLLVVGGDPVSGPAAYALSKAAWGLRPDAEIAALANRCDATRAELTLQSVASAARRFLDRPIARLGWLPEAPSLAEHPADVLATLERDEPALMSAAAGALGRLLRPAEPSHSSQLSLVR